VRNSAWKVLLGAGLFAIALVYVFLPGDIEHDILETTLNAVAVAALVIGIRWRKPQSRAGWWLITAGFFSYLIANVILTVYQIGNQRADQPFPYYTDAFYLAMPVLTSAGLLVFMRSRTLLTRGRLVDASVFIVAIGYAIYTFLIKPSVTADGSPLAVRLVSAAYPVSDVLLMACIVVLVFGAARRSTAYRLLLAGIACQVASDVIYSGQALVGSFAEGSIWTIGWEFLLLFAAAAALHPSMADLSAARPVEGEAGLATIFALTGGIAQAPFVYVAAASIGRGDPVELVVVSAVLFALVGGRLHELVSRDRTQRLALQRTLTDLHESERQRDLLLERTMAAGERERSRIASEIHDGPVQRLTAIGMRLARVTRAGADFDRTVLQTATKDVSSEVGNLRRMMNELLPPALAEAGLPAALGDLAHRVCSEGGITLREEIDHDLVPDSAEAATLLYRIAQEALTNVAKHSRASALTVSLRRNMDMLELSVTDNGVGCRFDGKQASRADPLHFGLASMRERATYCGGRFTVAVAEGGGTAIHVVVPSRLTRVAA
jgi:signal transduction histidine kinase